jgi:hypothetical protein
METIQADKKEAIKLYKSSDVKGKQMLKKLFPEISFEEPELTWEGICKIAKVDPVKDLPFQNPKNDRQEGANAFFQFSLIREVLNEVWIADFTTSEEKIVLWPNVVKDPSKPSGFGLSYNVYDFTHTGTFAGARLTFKDRKRAKLAFDNFLPILEKFYLLTKNK